MSQLVLFKKAVIFLMAFLLLNLPIAHSTESKKEVPNIDYTLFFALEGDNSQPSTKPRVYFDCTDKVFAVLAIKNMPLGRHELSLRWIGPHGQEQERVDYAFSVAKTETKLWAWLNLIRAKGAGMITWVNPAAGLEEFIGPWTVDAYVNDQKVRSGEFSVDC